MKNSTLSPDLADRMLHCALEHRERAYAPYSKYRVGAAILLDQEQLMGGCNVENASYGAVICAERTAVAAAVAAGWRSFQAILICGDHGPTPCGICLQVLGEFVDDMPVWCYDTKAQAYARRTTLRELAPHRFRLSRDE